MDFEMREWLTVIISLLILGVILDGWRRMRQSRRDTLKMSPNVRRSGGREEGSEGYGSELPNGGARVVGRRDPDEAVQLTKTLRKGLSEQQATRTFKAKGRKPEQRSLNLDEDAPILMESIAGQRHDAERVEPVLGGFDDDELYDAEPDNRYVSGADDGDDRYGEADDRYAEGYAENADADLDYDAHEATDSDPEEDQHASRSGQSRRAAAAAAGPDEVIIFNVMAKAGTYIGGQDLLDVLLECGMRYGDMHIFHCHLDEDGEGPVLFSLANMVKPGIFDLDEMDEFYTPGVSLFMTLPVAGESLEAFEIMVNVAKTLAVQLGADLKDENRSVMTGQTIEHCRQRIREYERKKKLAHAHY